MAVVVSAGLESIKQPLYVCEPCLEPSNVPAERPPAKCQQHKQGVIKRKNSGECGGQFERLLSDLKKSLFASSFFIRDFCETLAGDQS